MSHEGALRVYSEAISALSRKGCVLEFTNDRKSIVAAIEDVGKNYTTPTLNPANNDFTGLNGSWLLLRMDGDTVACIGYRIDEIPRGGITDFWQKSCSRGYGDPLEDNLVRLATELTTDLFGRMAYIGDLFVKRGAARRAGLVLPILSLIHAYIYMKHEPDWVYAFLKQVDMLRGADRKYLFFDSLTFPKAWADGQEPPGRESGETLVYSSRAKVGYHFDMQAEALNEDIRKGWVSSDDGAEDSGSSATILKIDG